MTLTDWLCRIYSALLYTYPREFRLAYGDEMQRVFRDRCRELSRGPGRTGLVRFSALSVADWAGTTFREGIEAIRKPRQPRGFVTEWTLTLIAYLFISTTLVQAYVVPTGSMESTLKVGDHMLVERVDRTLGRSFERGDIIAFTFPQDVRQTYVKRVIGLPGDRIRLESKQVIRNGRRLVEPYTQHVFRSRDAYRDDFPQPPDAQTTTLGLDMLQHHIVNGEVVVPPDTLFVLGDNRDNSLDSRYWGFVPKSYIAGRPLLVYWSFDAPTADLEEWSAAHVFDVAEHFFTKTRWDRIFLIPRSERAQETNP